MAHLEASTARAAPRNVLHFTVGGQAGMIDLDAVKVITVTPWAANKKNYQSAVVTANGIMMVDNTSEDILTQLGWLKAADTDDLLRQMSEAP